MYLQQQQQQHLNANNSPQVSPGVVQEIRRNTQPHVPLVPSMPSVQNYPSQLSSLAHTRSVSNHEPWGQTDGTCTIVKPGVPHRTLSHHINPRAQFPTTLRSDPAIGGSVLMNLHAVTVRRLTSHPFKQGRSTPGFYRTRLANQSPSV